MSEANGNFRIGLEVLSNLGQNKKQMLRKKNPLAHVYREDEGALRFKAIVHEDVEGIESTRRSFKAVITIVPLETVNTSLSIGIWLPWILSTIILIALNTLYVKNLVVVAVSCSIQLALMYISLKKSIAKEKQNARSNTSTIYQPDGA